MKSKFNILINKIISEQINSLVEDNIKNNLIYHGSPKDLNILQGDKTGEWSKQKGSVFVTPCKGLACCFLIDKYQIIKHIEQQLNGHINNLNFGYNIWNYPINQLYEIQNNIIIELNLQGFKQFSGQSQGYIYTIDYQKYKHKTHMFIKNPNSDVEFLINGNVEYIKKQKIKINWICRSSKEEIKRHGKATIKSFNNIQNIQDLKNFYYILDYDIPKRNQNFDKWKLLSIPQIIKYKVGICYDTAYMTHQYFKKWNIEHVNCFACTERNNKDHKYNDPTHTFIVYKESIKNITFPQEQIETLSKQNNIITTRVSNQFDKFFPGDIVITPWNKTFKVINRIEINNVYEHPFFNELTKEQINLLKQFNKIAIIELQSYIPKWKWLEGSWWNYMNNDWEANTKEQLINRILKVLAEEENGLKYIAAQFKDYPKPGTSMNDFFHSLVDLTDWIYK